MTEEINIFIAGSPAPQGSKRHVGGGVMIESCKALKPWRESIRYALRGADGRPCHHFDQAVSCALEFILPRPKTAPKRSTPAAVKKPDVDKLTRAVFDAITSACVIRDDSQIIEVYSRKRLAQIGETPGLRLRLRAEAQDTKQAA